MEILISPTGHRDRWLGGSRAGRHIRHLLVSPGVISEPIDNLLGFTKEATWSF